MTRKVTLTVPDDLADEIHEWRSFLGNLSALFQEAVREEIKRKKRHLATCDHALKQYQKLSPEERETFKALMAKP